MYEQSESILISKKVLIIGEAIERFQIRGKLKGSLINFIEKNFIYICVYKCAYI